MEKYHRVLSCSVPQTKAAPRAGDFHRTYRKVAKHEINLVIPREPRTNESSSRARAHAVGVITCPRVVWFSLPFFFFALHAASHLLPTRRWGAYGTPNHTPELRCLR